ncbi:MAG TPA: endolytic transglycosylase MltG, partial [Streptosporangiaceae bacterium]|nr:endolytic transglycosylase MltG [Streptosporangiaceae bacterium]
ARAFSNAAKASGQGTALEPGYYRVRLHMNAALAFALLLKPSSRMQTRVTIPEGWRLSQIIATLGRDTGRPQGYQQAIKNIAALNLPSFAQGHPEGYLFPATYDVQPNTRPLKVLQDMVTRFDQEAASIHLPAAAAHAELTQSDVIIVASLIQAEGRRPSDFPKIARVIYNRLNSNPQIPLQLDSTVMFALHKYGIIASSQQIKVKSRYNTYLHTGLPPGPIDSPGTAAINAALHPAHGTWMYFVTVDPKTGVTKFTSSFTQFQQFRAELESNIAKGK